MKTYLTSILFFLTVLGTNLVSANGLDFAQLDDKEKITVYPNPANNKATIQFNTEESCEITVEIFDLSGKKIKEIGKQQIQIGEQQIPITTDQIKDGIYLCRIRSSKWVKALRIVIKH